MSYSMNLLIKLKDQFKGTLSKTPDNPSEREMVDFLNAYFAAIWDLTRDSFVSIIRSVEVFDLFGSSGIHTLIANARLLEPGKRGGGLTAWYDHHDLPSRAPFKTQEGAFWESFIKLGISEAEWNTYTLRYQKNISKIWKDSVQMYKLDNSTLFVTASSVFMIRDESLSHSD